MPEKSYEEGLRDGQISALEKIVSDHKGRLDNHSQRIRALERVMWIMIGAIALMEFWPRIQSFMAGVG